MNNGHKVGDWSKEMQGICNMVENNGDDGGNSGAK